MFDIIVQAANHKGGKALRIEKRVLNFLTFDTILEEGPKLLFIMCHGQLNRRTGMSNFWFENEERPYLGDSYSEDRLVECLQRKGRNHGIQAIVLSTCHSEKLGKIFVKGLSP